MNRVRYWKDVSDILKSDELGEEVLARDLYRRYCTSGRPQIDGGNSLVNEDDAERSLSWVR